MAACELDLRVKELAAVVTGDLEIFRAPVGVCKAATAVQEHFVCARCRATKGDALEGEQFVVWAVLSVPKFRQFRISGER